MMYENKIDNLDLAIVNYMAKIDEDSKAYDDLCDLLDDLNHLRDVLKTLDSGLIEVKDKFKEIKRKGGE